MVISQKPSLDSHQARFGFQFLREPVKFSQGHNDAAVEMHQITSGSLILWLPYSYYISPLFHSALHFLLLFLDKGHELCFAWLYILHCSTCWSGIFIIQKHHAFSVHFMHMHIINHTFVLAEAAFTSFLVYDLSLGRKEAQEASKRIPPKSSAI